MSGLQFGLQVTTTCSPRLPGNTGASPPTRDKTPIRFPIVPAASYPPGIRCPVNGGLR